MAHAHFLVGTQGSGKSTYARAALEGAVVSSDAIRKELTGNQADLTREEEVWALFWKRVTDLLQQGKNVVIDATNTSPERRAQDVARCWEAGATRVVAHLMNTPLDTCLALNAEREAPVPPDDIIKMHDRLAVSPPSEDEGFSAVTVVAFNRH